MKNKYLIGMLAGAIAFAACKKDDDQDTVPVQRPYITDNLTVSPDPTALLYLTTGAWCQFCPNGGERLLEAKVKYGHQVVPLVARTGSDPLVNVLTDELNDIYEASGVPHFYVNEEAAGQSIDGPLAFALAFDRPIGVAHAVETTDTGYVVNIKIEVFENMKDVVFYVQSYLILDKIEARNFGPGADMRQTSTVPTVDKGNDVSRWTREAAFVNGEPQVRPGDTYYHTSNLFSKAKNTDLWGLPLNDFNPFKDQYIEGDILGTRYTPIQLTLEKVNVSPIVVQEYAVTTIIWGQVPGDGNEDKRAFVAGFTSTIANP
jgi:hypothetical protein